MLPTAPSQKTPDPGRGFVPSLATLTLVRIQVVVARCLQRKVFSPSVTSRCLEGSCLWNYVNILFSQELSFRSVHSSIDCCLKQLKLWGPREFSSVSPSKYVFVTFCFAQVK